MLYVSLPTFNLSRVAGIAVLRGEEAANRRVDNSQQSEIGLAKKLPRSLTITCSHWTFRRLLN